MELDHGRPMPGAGIAVADGDGDRLLEGQDVPEVGIAAEGVEEPLLDGPRVAEDIADVIGEQLLEDGVPPRPGGGHPVVHDRTDGATSHTGSDPLPGPRPSSRLSGTNPGSTGR